jgi:adenylylsulfate kinase
MEHESHGRSIAKAVSWRVVGTMATTLLVFALTRRFVLSVAAGALEFVSKIGLYWLHERIWDRVALGRVEQKPAVLWFTGLSGAGKSAIAEWVHAELRRRGHRVERLDGDAIRSILPGTGFTRTERDQHLRRVGYLASKLEQNGITVIATFVSPYEESRAFVRGLCANFIEIHVATPLEECERRDVKGLYAKARRGEIHSFTGIDDPYEAPRHPELRIDTSTMSVEDAGACVVECLAQRVATRRLRRPMRDVGRALLVRANA